jgi:hypothetical protein
VDRDDDDYDDHHRHYRRRRHISLAREMKKLSSISASR